MPILSICIPTYCQTNFLRETLRSIQNQNFDDYELIVSDDSPDDTVAQLVATFNFDGRLFYHRNPNPLGSPKNWNEVIRRAKGDYIKLLHHDDQLEHPGALGGFVRLLEENPRADFAFCASGVKDITSGKKSVHFPSNKQLSMLSSTPEYLFFGNTIGAPSATIYRNGLGIEYDNNMKWLVDIDFYIRILERNPCYAYTPEVLITTPTNAPHQVTGICENNAAIELIEYLILYSKVATQLQNRPETYQTWFRLFEKYHIYTQTDLDQIGIELPLSRDLLTPFFNSYRSQSLSRVPNRIYANLPEPLKKLTRRFKRFL